MARYKLTETEVPKADWDDQDTITLWVDESSDESPDVVQDSHTIELTKAQLCELLGAVLLVGGKS